MASLRAGKKCSVLILSNENQQENIINKLISAGIKEIVKANESPGILSLKII